MPKPTPSVVCDACHRTLGPGDRWIVLDGRQVWCAECWRKRFSGGLPGGAPGDLPADAGAGPAAVRGLAAPRELEFADIELVDDEAAEAQGPAPPEAGPHAHPDAPGGLPPGARGEAPAGSRVVVVQSGGGAAGGGLARTSGLAVASFVLALVGIFTPCVGVLFGGMAVIFGAIALSATSSDPSLRGRGLALAGLLTGVVDIVGWILISAVLGLLPTDFL